MVQACKIRMWGGAVGLAASLASLFSLFAETSRVDTLIAPYNHSAGPTMLKLDMAFSAGPQTNGQELVPIKPDVNAHMGGFIYRYPPFAGLIANQWPGASYCNNLTWEFRDQTRAWLVGERRLAVVVNNQYCPGLH